MLKRISALHSFLRPNSILYVYAKHFVYPFTDTFGNCFVSGVGRQVVKGRETRRHRLEPLLMVQRTDKEDLNQVSDTGDGKPGLVGTEQGTHSFGLTGAD